jgi:hypothetical protein
MKLQPTDRVTLDSKEYVYRDGYWTTPVGYRVSTSQGQQLTCAFHQRHGRLPSYPPPAPVRGARKTRVAAT